MTVATEQTCRLAAKTLKDAVALAASALPRRTNVPILFNLLLTTEDGGRLLTVTGMDLEIAVKATVPTGVMLADAEQDFATCLNGAKFAEFASSLPDSQPVEMVVTDKAVVVTCARSRGRFLVTDPEEYPPFPGTKGVTPLATAMGQRIAKAFDAVLPFVAANDKGRPSLMGAYLNVKGGELTTMGADGYIVSVYRALDYGVPEGKRADLKRDTEVIVSGRGAAKLAQVATDAGEERVTLSLVGEDDNPSGVLLDNESDERRVVAYARCLEGPFPAAGILSVLPNHGESETMPSVTVTGPLLASAVRRVSTFGTDSVYGTPINLSVTGAGYEKQGVLTVSAAGAEEGEGVDTLDCEAMSGYGDPIGDATLYTKLGSRYIVDAIRAVKDVTGSETVYLGFRDPAKAFTFNDGTHDYKIALAPLAGAAPPPPPVEVPDVDEFAPADLSDA